MPRPVFSASNPLRHVQQSQARLSAREQKTDRAGRNVFSTLSVDPIDTLYTETQAVLRKVKARENLAAAAPARTSSLQKTRNRPVHSHTSIPTSLPTVTLAQQAIDAAKCVNVNIRERNFQAATQALQRAEALLARTAQTFHNTYPHERSGASGRTAAVHTFTNARMTVINARRNLDRAILQQDNNLRLAKLAPKR
jgi:hypothetical protein